MPIVSLEIPPGAYRNGTEYQAKGRWRDVNLVRWHEGATRPVGGWTAVTLTEGFIATVSGGYAVTPTMADPRGAMTWVDNAETPYAVWADDDEVAALVGAAIFDVTPAAGYAGSNDWVSFDTFGQIPIMCGQEDGDIWEWDLTTSGNFTQVTGSPTGNTSIVVADERFIMALQARRVEWCDRDDRTVWTDLTTNQAGGFDLDTEGELMFGLQMRGEVLIVGTRDAWSARYIGHPEVWEFRRIGRTSAVGGTCGVSIGDRAFWLGRDGFWSYAAGYVGPLECDVWDFLETDIEFREAYGAGPRTIFAWHNIAFHEVTWHYRASGSSQKDSYVSYNYVTGTWSYGSTPFGAVAETNAFDYPIGFCEPDDISSNGFDDNFNSDIGWTLGTNWQITGGNLTQSAPAASSASYAISIWAASTEVYLTVVIANRTAGSLTITFGTTTSAISSNGTYQAVLTTGASPETLTITADGTWDGDVGRIWLTRVPLMQLEDGNLHQYVAAPFAKTGPLEIGNGERRVHVTRVLPDEQDAGELTLTFTHREYPTATETTETAVTAANPTDVRFSGRQFTMQVAPSSSVDWRSGVHRLEIAAGGKR